MIASGGQGDDGQVQRLTLPRSRRLRGRGAFGKVFAGRSRKSVGPLVMHSVPNGLAHHRFGISVGRRVGTAVKRNRIKRLLREAYRLSQHELPGAGGGLDVVAVVQPHEALRLEAYREFLGKLFAISAGLWAKRAER